MKIVFADIESTPMEAYAWGPKQYEQNLCRIKKHSELLSLAWQWEGKKRIHCATRQNRPTDKELTLIARNVLDEADVVIGHNLKEFDRKKINTRCLKYGITPPSPYQIVDTLIILRQNFALPSNKLDDVCDFLGIGTKLKHAGIQLWFDCMDDVPAAWRFMKRYNIHDIVLLKPLYKYLRPWHKTHPNLADAEKIQCTVCRSMDLQSRGTAKKKGGLIYSRYQCNDCGHWDRGTVRHRPGKMLVTSA